MKNTFRLAAIVCAASLSSQLLAEDKYTVHAIQSGDEGVRYLKGVPTVDLERNDGVVQITPLPMDHGSLAFGVAVYNDGMVPANLGIENVRVNFGDTGVQVFSARDMVRKAKRRATWSSIGLALLGGVAAGAAASQRNYYTSRFVTPRGTYTSWFSTPSLAGQLQASAITAGTGVSIGLIQNQLDRTIATIGDQTIQLTTVDPGESYAGQFVIDKVRPKSLPATINVEIDWNGETYPFTFQVAKPGSAAPQFVPVARRSNLTDYRQLAALNRSDLPLALAPAALARPAAQSVAPTPTAPRVQPAKPQKLGTHVTCVTCRN